MIISNVLVKNKENDGKLILLIFSTVFIFSLFTFSILDHSVNNSLIAKYREQILINSVKQADSLSEVKLNHNRSVTSNSLNYTFISKTIDIKDKITFLDNLSMRTLIDFNPSKPSNQIITLNTLVKNYGDNKEVIYFELVSDKKKEQYYLDHDSYYDKHGKGIKKIPLFGKPLDGRLIVNSKFGLRSHPVLKAKKAKMHTGVDLKAKQGTPVYSASDGKIEFFGTKRGYGKYVVIRHALGYKSAYGHLSSFSKNLKIGGHVKKGQLIAKVGSTGLASGPHLHYEIINNGKFVDPMLVNVSLPKTMDRNYLESFNETIKNIDSILEGIKIEDSII